MTVILYSLIKNANDKDAVLSMVINLFGSKTMRMPENVRLR